MDGSMSARYEFSVRGQSDRKPYHFKACGLPNVYLTNGVKIENDPDYGELITIQRLPELFIAIAFRLVVKPKKLTGHEFRFLRKRVEMTQSELAREFRVNEQTIANYEKEKTDAGPADLALRLLYLAHVADDDDVAQELRSAAEDLMKPSRRGRSEPPKVGPWVASA
jgi:DNA-binding transcriptional regulator YiaG